MREALKGEWRVTAGVLLNTPEEEHSLRHEYSAKDLAEDEMTCERNKKIMKEAEDRGEQVLVSDLQDTIFMERREDAIRHAREIMNPNRVNWVRLEFVWY